MYRAPTDAETDPTPRRIWLETRLLFGAFAFAEEGFEGVGAGEIVEEASALFGIHLGGEKFLAFFAELPKPGFVFRAELLFEFFAEALGQGGTLAGSGDRDLERATLHYGGVVEVAELGHVDDVAEDAAPSSLGENVFVEFLRMGGGNDEKHSVEVGGLKPTREALDLPRGGPEAYLPGGFRSDDTDFGRGVEQAGDFSLGDRTRADDEAGASGELDEDWKEARSRSLLGSGLHRVILTEK